MCIFLFLNSIMGKVFFQKIERTLKEWNFLKKSKLGFYSIVGELTAQNDWLKKNWRNWKVF